MASKIEFKYDFRVYSIGLVCASACTRLGDEETTRRLNLEHPTGVTPWAIADEPFASGDPNPRPCDQLSDTHRHILFHC